MDQEEVSARVRSVYEDSWDRRLDEPGFRVRLCRLGAALGGELLGASVYEIEPAQCGMPYHVHHANEELLLLLRGAIAVRTPDGEVALKEGDAILFRRGMSGAHQVLNRSDDVARYLVVSTLVYPEVAEFPDTGKIYVQAAAADDALSKILDANAERGWLDGEPPQTSNSHHVTKG
jgi:uncharacterized cupin superfamily protein